MVILCTYWGKPYPLSTFLVITRRSDVAYTIATCGQHHMQSFKLLEGGHSPLNIAYAPLAILVLLHNVSVGLGLDISRRQTYDVACTTPASGDLHIYVTDRSIPKTSTGTHVVTRMASHPRGKSSSLGPASWEAEEHWIFPRPPQPRAVQEYK
jgi:hypothetical protein